LLSNHPIIDHDLPQLRTNRHDLRARLTIRDTELTAIVAHPLPPKLTRRGVVADPESARHVDGLLNLALETSPAIILGDFNMTPRNLLYHRLRKAGLVDAFDSAGTGRGLTFPVRPGKMRSINHRMHWLPLVPLSRIDYIWHTREITTLDAWVGPNAGSDHLPVLATLDLGQADGPEQVVRAL
jgi:vancomycin resistance protein VanJ